MSIASSQAVKEMYRHWAQERWSPSAYQEPRETNDHWGDVTAEPRGVDYRETETDVPFLWASPKGCSADRVLLCFHGGGFVSGSIYTHRKLYAHLAKTAGVRALIAHYRLTPENVFPAQLDDAVEAYRFLLGQNIAPEHIALAGDSSGGGLCVTMMLRSRELGLPLPAAALLISPWVDMEVNGASYQTNRNTDVFFHAEVVRELAAAYLGPSGDTRNPLANPLYADLGGLPPLAIQAGGDETLLDDSRRLERRVLAFGGSAFLDVFEGQQHTFQMAAGRAPEADDAIRRLAAWVRPRLGLEP
jgi:acetyl esterase/lipase